MHATVHKSPPQPPATIAGLLAQRLDRDAQRIALHLPAGESYRTLTWAAFVRETLRWAAALHARGIRPGDRVVQISPNRGEWLLADLALQVLQAVHVPVHASLAGPQMHYQICDCEAALVLLAGPTEAAALATVEEPWPACAFVSYDPVDQPLAGRQVACLPDEVARLAADSGADLLSVALRDGRSDDLATILYTSGTTGEPKGVMLTQRNLVSNAWDVAYTVGCEPDDLRLNWLPLSHIYARTCDFYTWLATGVQLALAESRETILAHCARLQPTVINGVPYFYDKVMRVVQERGGADPAGALRKLLGGQMRICHSGGAPLPDAVARFFNEHEMPLLQGYGLTETSPVITMSTLEAHRLGCVGQAIHGVEVRIAEDGEILTRGPHVMRGYWKKPQATDEVLRDGWFHTGDLGSLDEEGYLKITGRKKELIVTAGGKNIAPNYLEALLTADPLIAQCVVIGDRQKYLAALIVPNAQPLATELAKLGLSERPWPGVLQEPDVYALYESRVQSLLSGVSREERVRKFVLLPAPFAVETGELTTTLKLRRQAIAARYAEQIAALYQAAE